jgi:hypothetical protein
MVGQATFVRRTDIVRLIPMPVYRVLDPLLFRVEWSYQDEGIMSIGHLRFFTTRTMRRLIIGAGYTIVREEANYRRKGLWLRRLSLGLLDEFVAEQRFFVARYGSSA